MLCFRESDRLSLEVTLFLGLNLLQKFSVWIDGKVWYFIWIYEWIITNRCLVLYVRLEHFNCQFLTLFIVKRVLNVLVLTGWSIYNLSCFRFNLNNFLFHLTGTLLLNLLCIFVNRLLNHSYTDNSISFASIVFSDLLLLHRMIRKSSWIGINEAFYRVLLPLFTDKTTCLVVDDNFWCNILFNQNLRTI